MQFVSRLALPIFSLISFLALASAPAFAGDFAHQGVAADAQRYETFLKANWKTDGKTAGRPQGRGREGLRCRSARSLASAGQRGRCKPTRTPRLDAARRGAAGHQARSENGGERYDLPVNASGAAYRGYQLAQDPLQKATRASCARPDAGAPLLLAPRHRCLQDRASNSPTSQAVREAYDKLRAEHGFRMTDYKDRQ